jgi:phage FluMu gp28-like protein
VRHADRHTALLVAACMLRRAAIMAATIVALGLGV